MNPLQFPSTRRNGPDECLPRILMVDDRPANLVALEATLAPLGAELVRASSGDEALRKVLEGDFAVILMDVQMPGLDGLATASMIRKRPRNRATPIIFLTAIARDPSNIFRGYLEGAVDYLVKPIDGEILRAKVSVFVELWKKTEQVQRQQEQLREQQLRDQERRSELRFRAIIESLPACVWVANRNGEIAYCNRVWHDYAGPDAGVAFFSAVPSDEVEEVRTAWVTAVRERQGLERELRLRRRDGQWRWHLLRVVPERDPDGEVMNWVAAAADIDDRKRAEQAHASALAREQEARSQAELANRSKDEFLATVSHELRTPLHAILGWTRMLRSGEAGPERLGQALETIERNARTQTQLIEDLLDVSRIVAGKLRVDVRPMDLAAAAREAVEALRPSAQARGLRIEVDAPESLPFEGDPERLKQIVWNLLANAIKFTPAGTVSVALRCERHNVELIVADTGIGISRDFLPHVFERFRQADSSLSRSAGGLGLGLAIVRHLVEVHGGTVKAESEGEGKGSRFVIRLPVSNLRVEAIRPQPLRRLSRDALRGVRLLIVDDDADSRQLTAEIMTNYGASVSSAAAADEAMELVHAIEFDAIVSDISLPREDGYSLIRRIRALPNGQRMAAIALTAHAAARDAQSAADAGFERYFCKPFEPAELASAIAELIQHRAAATPGDVASVVQLPVALAASP